jgi:hypothetical protein
MVSSSKKSLGKGDVSNLLDSNEFAEKPLHSVTSEYSDANESCVTDFGNQELDACRW